MSPISTFQCNTPATLIAHAYNQNSTPSPLYQSYNRPQRALPVLLRLPEPPLLNLTKLILNAVSESDQTKLILNAVYLNPIVAAIYVRRSQVHPIPSIHLHIRALPGPEAADPSQAASYLD